MFLLHAFPFVSKTAWHAIKFPDAPGSSMPALVTLGLSTIKSSHDVEHPFK
jgi:hypothetical protein